MSETDLKTWNVNTTTGTFAGNILEGPWAGDDAIEITPLGDDWNGEVGMKGGFTRGQQQEGRHYDVVLKFHSTSPSCKLLTALRELDIDPAGSGAPAVLSIRDASIARTFSCRQAYIKKQPDRKASRTVPTEEWALFAPNGVFTYDA